MVVPETETRDPVVATADFLNDATADAALVIAAGVNLVGTAVG